MKLRIAQQEDIKIILDMAYSDDVWPNLTSDRGDLTQANMIAILTKGVSKVFLAYDENKGNKIIGFVTLNDIDYLNRCCYIGNLIIDPKHHKDNYGKQLVRAALNYCFGTLNMHHVIGIVWEDNVWAKSLLHQGFKLEGTFREASFKNGKYINKLYFGILESEYLEMVKQWLKPQMSIAS